MPIFGRWCLFSLIIYFHFKYVLFTRSSPPSLSALLELTSQLQIRCASPVGKSAVLFLGDISPFPPLLSHNIFPTISAILLCKSFCACPHLRNLCGQLHAGLTLCNSALVTSHVVILSVHLAPSYSAPSQRPFPSLQCTSSRTTPFSYERRHPLFPRQVNRTCSSAV